MILKVKVLKYEEGKDLECLILETQASVFIDPFVLNVVAREEAAAMVGKTYEFECVPYVVIARFAKEVK